MDFGKGWVIFECINDYSVYEIDNSKELISILPPRYTQKIVSKFILQMYIDRYADWEDKLLHKKQKLTSIKPIINGSSIYVGRDLMLMALCCDKIKKIENKLEVKYKITNIEKFTGMTSVEHHSTIISIKHVEKEKRGEV